MLDTKLPAPNQTSKSKQQCASECLAVCRMKHLFPPNTD